MKKKIAVPLFCIDRATGLATQEYDPSARWVHDLAAPDFAKIDIDGRFVRILNGGYYFLYDWKPRTTAVRAAQIAYGYRWHTCASFKPEDFDPLPDSAFPCAPLEPVTGYDPYWYPAYHLHGYAYLRQAIDQRGANPRNTFYELVGPKIQGNPYGLAAHYLIPYFVYHPAIAPKPEYAEIKDWFAENYEEGISWHREDGSIARVKRKDFGFSWPTPQAKWSEEKLSILRA